MFADAHNSIFYTIFINSLVIFYSLDGPALTFLKMRLQIRIKVRFYCVSLRLHLAVSRGEMNTAVEFLPDFSFNESVIAESFAFELIFVGSR